jgi:DNA-binding beta-propeller fold protein YncE
MLKAITLALAVTLVPDPTIQTLTVRSRPFMALASVDGATLFVSSQHGNGGAITTFRAGPAGFERSGVTLLRAPALGIAFVPDGSTLVVANDSGVALLDARALAAGTSPDPRYVDDPGAQIIAVTVSRDGRYAFASEELTQELAVIKIAESGSAIVGRVRLDGAPVGMAVSADGSRLYVTSESAAPFASERGCRIGRHGTLSTIDTARAETDPTHAKIARNEIGCSPVRVQLSPGGDIAWVTLRGEDHVAAYATADLQTDGSPKPRAIVPTGSAPVGIAFARHGSLAIVANSARFETMPNASTFSVFSTDAALANGTASPTSYPAKVFPREVTVSSDESNIFLTDYASDAVQVIDPTRLH